MVNLQKEFLDFHEEIKLDDENQTLRDKRDTLLKKLKDNISAQAASYTHFNQGSYAMGTGIKPEDGDYDIDVGLKFDISKDDYPDPIIVKKWVRDALNGHTKSVEIRRSCVTVTYQNKGEALYHVDFAVYAANNSDDKLYLAKGKEFSSTENKIWDISDPLGLMGIIKSKFTGDDRTQFRRVVRYMKKWRSHKLASNGNSGPTGIALTVLAYDLFSVSSAKDWTSDKTTYDDFTALCEFANAIKNKFGLTWDSSDSCFYHTISQKLPVEPYNNLFEKMTNRQMDEFYAKISDMVSKLEEVKGKNKKSEACKVLIELFGTEFPATVDKSYVGTSESA